MRVGHVVVSYSRHEGIGRSVEEVARRIEGTHVLLTNELLFESPAFERSVAVGGSRELFHVTHRAAIEAIVRSEDLQVLHVHGGIVALFLARSLASLAPVVASIYSWTTLDPSTFRSLEGYREGRRSEALRPRAAVGSAVPRRLARRTAAQLACVLTPDRRVLEGLRGAGADVRLLYGTGQRGRPRVAPDPTRRIVFFAGKAERARGILDLVAAFELLAEDLPDVHLDLALLPSWDLDEVVAAVAGSPASHRITCTTKPDPALEQRMLRASVGAWPFRYDQATIAPALAPMEAAAVGLPLVVTDSACLSTALDATNAVVVPRRDPAALAEGLRRALGDAATWQRLADAAYGVVQERWSWDRAAEATDGAYRKAIG